MTIKPQIHEEQTLKEALYRVIFESDTMPAGSLTES